MSTENYIKLTIGADKYIISPADMDNLKTTYLAAKGFGDKSKFTTGDSGLLKYWLEGRLRAGDDLRGLGLIPTQSKRAQVAKRAARTANRAPRVRIIVQVPAPTERKLATLADACGKNIQDMFSEFAAALSDNSPRAFYSALSALQGTKKQTF